MKLNKKLQLGLLFSLYLARNGKTTVACAALSLGVSASFLSLVAHNLCKGGVVKSSKGPNGGYELNGEPLVGEIFKALAPVLLVNTNRAVGSSHECRALYSFASNLTQSMAPLMNRKIKNLVGELYANDLAKLNKPTPYLQVN